MWLGKPHRGLPRSLVDTLNRQIEARHPTYLFLIDPDPCSRDFAIFGDARWKIQHDQWNPGLYREYNKDF